ncbi:MAG TPA: APC family permease [Vicinamibacterales bacterium]|nr:APC family permease [Vicinamibacterales bacterium]
MAVPEAARGGAADVTARSAALRKDLSIRDLAFAQILFIVGLQWVGVAAKLGPSHVIFWLIGITLFYLPSAVVAVWLNRVMPLEGGLYQWAKLGFNESFGFIVAWNLWLFGILNMSNIGLQFTQYIGYIFGPRVAAVMAQDPVVAAMMAAVTIGLVWITVAGLRVGRWVHTLGGVLMLLMFAMIIALPWVHQARGLLPAYHPLDTAVPVISIMSLNLMGKMGFGAFAGFEYVAIHAGECRDPIRSITRATVVAAPIIIAMFILGTSAVLNLVPQDQIDLIAPIPQLLSIGFGPLGAVAAIVPLTLSAMLAIRFAQASVNFAGASRLPMVAGWDSLLPAWFTRLSPRFKTPVNSIAFVGAAMLVLSSLGLIGVGKQEAFQLLWNSAGIFYALTYLAMFAVPLAGFRRSAVKPPWWIKLCALSGFLMTALYVTLSVLPIIPVGSRTVFALKITGLIVVTNAVGMVFYATGRRRARLSQRVPIG